jgi:hypothetical protein
MAPSRRTPGSEAEDVRLDGEAVYSSGLNSNAQPLMQ